MLCFMLNDQNSDLNEKGNLLPSFNGLLFQSSTKGYFICTILVFIIPVVEHWLEQKTAQWAHQENQTDGLYN